MTPTAEQIDQLIESRNKMTNRRDEQIDFAVVKLIDTKLREVPAGQRNDVDLLLGRLCAQLPNRAALQAAAHEAGVTAEWLTPEQVAQLEARTAETERADDYDNGTEGHW